LRQFPCTLHRFIEISAANDELGSKCNHGSVLLWVVSLGDNYHRLKIISRGGKRYTLTMIAPRCSTNARNTGFTLFQITQVNQATAYFERAGGIVVFVFYPDLAVAAVI
jgi:hypothetical protein